FFTEGIDTRRAGFRHEHHIGGLNAFPAGDGRTVEHDPGLEALFIDSVSRYGEVVFFAKRIGKTEINESDLVVGNHLENIFGGGHKGSWTSCAEGTRWLKQWPCQLLGGVAPRKARTAPACGMRSSPRRCTMHQ